MLGAHSNEVSLVMTDDDMPRLGGAALIRASLRLRSDLRVIGMSGLFGDESDGSEIQTVQKLAHAFLRKPFKPEELLSAVHRLISKQSN